MAKSDQNLIWIDLEMTGLDPETDRILEIATIVTDSNLNVIAEGPVCAVHQPAVVLDNMNEWCINTHAKSGLTNRVKASSYSEQTAEQATLEFLQQYVPAGVSPMCGNSICQDRRFLVRYMPALLHYFHYRHLDVSTVKILAQHWYPEVFKQFRKDTTHMALNDIYDSIEELKFYRQHIFLNDLPK